MAAIDKMYLKDYYVFDEFRLWCLIHNPKLLNHFYHWNMIHKEWEQWKESVYEGYYKKIVDYLFDGYYKNRSVELNKYFIKFNSRCT